MATTRGIRSLSAWPEVHLLAPLALGECCHRSLAGRGIAVGSNLIPCYQPPVRNRLKSRRFSSATRSRSTFRGKRTGNCGWLTPDGTIRRSFRRTAAGQLAGGWKGETYPPPDKAMTPLKKLRPPLRPPLFFPAMGAAHVHRTGIFRPRF
jgi:hypothetical protein